MELTNLSFFNGVNKTLLNKVSVVFLKYIKNETVYSQGLPCKSMDIVLSGELVAYSLTANGSESIVFDFKKGSSIGTNLLFGNVNNYPMNIYCTEDCELLHIGKPDVEFLLQDPHFMMNFIRSISLNSQGMNRKIVMFTQKTLRENLLDYFSALSAEQKSQTVTLPISKKQLADYLSVQRPSLFRELKKMKDEGLIEVNNRKIKINGQ
ncbi:MAG: Crp/Fnr family transcriptional regulator [Bacillota bacterium]|nr:Crp/Fnr family transcriptional regulator [Bacillota bacterium]MDD3299001.1 Crp/Fnr family transcriptional regulator [Bacillota bacterium]MDD3851774.1 Crp/Fnr family transcriptional regulator [Bacillota bacterium]MDD4708322.1 Crp/Fnr family transcriptional regulator [Bacillota bacterium]